MPNSEIMKLTSTSPDAQVKAAISACIANEVKAGHPQDQAIAMCYAMVSKQTGKSLSEPGAKTPNKQSPPTNNNMNGGI